MVSRNGAEGADYWQCAFVIRKGDVEETQRNGIEDQSVPPSGGLCTTLSWCYVGQVDNPMPLVFPTTGQLQKSWGRNRRERPRENRAFRRAAGAPDAACRNCGTKNERHWVNNLPH